MSCAETDRSGVPIMAHLLVLALLVLATPAMASDSGWEAMRQPGAIALMRHAYAPGYSDPDEFRIGDCSTQRNLNHEGRDQARKIGEAFRANGIEIDRVLASQWCRSYETAELLDLGPVEALPSLNSFFEARHLAEEQTRDTMAFLRDLPRDSRVVMVSHQVNVSALTGRGTSSGEFIVVRLAPDGELKVEGSVFVPY
jgi:phosphohistidine phosphatase SixA